MHVNSRRKYEVNDKQSGHILYSTVNAQQSFPKFMQLTGILCSHPVYANGQ